MTQFSSRDLGSTHDQIEAQISTMKEMRIHLEEAVEVVRSHATQLGTILGKSQVIKLHNCIITMLINRCY